MTKRITNVTNSPLGKTLVILYLSIGCVAALIAGTMGYAYWTGHQMAARHGPLIDGAMEIKLEATTAHLWLEEVLTGDRHVGLDVVLAHLDAADHYAQMMLEGGQTEEGPLLPLVDPQMRTDIEEVRTQLAEFHRITLERWQARADSGIGTPIDQKYDAVFQAFMLQADQVETQLQALIQGELRSFRITQNVLTCVCVVVTLFLGVVFTRFFCRQARDQALLDAANQQLDAQNQQLHASNQQLLATEQQLRAFNQQLEAANQQLLATEQQLRASNQQLEAGNQQLMATEQQLRASNQQLRSSEHHVRQERDRAQAYFDLAGTMLVVLGADGRIQRLNRKASEVLGDTEENLTGKDWFAHCLPERLRSGTRFAFEQLRSGEIEPSEFHEYSILNAQGEERLVAWRNAILRDGREGVMATLSSGEDITDRVRLQETIVQTEKMLTVGGLAAGMAHEINNPLAGILQNIQVMRNRLSTELDQNRETAEQCNTTIEAIEAYMKRRKLPEMMDFVMDSGKRAARIVDNMLSFARKSGAQFVPCDLADLIDQSVELAANDYDLKKHHDFRHIEIVKDYALDLPSVPCEASKIQQVVLNVLKNGAEAMTGYHQGQGPSRFVLRTRKVDLMARIEIEDNGPGMDESIRKRIFEPFFTTKEVGKGTGLGLSVSYFIVTENHEGHMDVETTPGQGARFVIDLPFDEGNHGTKHRHSTVANRENSSGRSARGPRLTSGLGL